MNQILVGQVVHCEQCGTDRRITGTLGPKDARRYLTLSTCGHVVAVESGGVA